MDRYSRVGVLVCLFFATAFADGMTDLDDIERDNLRAEGASSTEASYGSTDKPITGQPDYQQEPRRYQSEDRSSGHAGQDKYAPEGYERGSQYSENDVGYLEPIQRYGEYDRQRQAVSAVANGPSHEAAYEPRQRLFHRPEVALGSRYQTALQKEPTEKYSEIPDREPLYFSIPMSQLLAYYPSLSAGQPTIPNSEAQHPYRLANENSRKIVIPVYAPVQSREPIHADSKVAHRIEPQYSSSDSNYRQHTEAILPTKRPSKLIYGQNVPSHRRPQAQPDRYLRIVYTRPGAIHGPELSPSHADVYPERASVHLRGNGPGRSHDGQSGDRQYASYAQPETYYALHAAHAATQLTDHLYQHQSADNALQNYEAIPEPPTGEHDLPRLPAQNFIKPGAGLQLVSVSNESEDSQYSHNHLDHSSEPRSLLDSYVPSQLIAAQDSERYRERPIRLERGFIPSKIDFVQSHKKRNAE